MATYPRKETEAPRLLAAYMARIGGRRGLLSHREEVELGRRARAGGSEARRRFVEMNLHLALSVARNYRGQDLPLEVLIQEGNTGLIKTGIF